MPPKLNYLAYYKVFCTRVDQERDFEQECCVNNLGEDCVTRDDFTSCVTLSCLWTVSWSMKKRCLYWA